MHVHVVSASELTFKGKRYRCAIGANGFTSDPKEGDKATPLGIYPLRECWYRSDLLRQPETGLPLKVIHKDDGWCDAPDSPDYNLHVKLPFGASHETLWRADHTYDLIVPIGFNDAPVIAGKGSAIFFHCAKLEYSPTLGCVAIARDDLLEILTGLTPHSMIEIAPL